MLYGETDSICMFQFSPRIHWWYPFRTCRQHRTCALHVKFRSIWACATRFRWIFNLTYIEGGHWRWWVESFYDEGMGGGGKSGTRAWGRMEAGMGSHFMKENYCYEMIIYIWYFIYEKTISTRSIVISNTGKGRRHNTWKQVWYFSQPS